MEQLQLGHKSHSIFSPSWPRIRLGLAKKCKAKAWHSPCYIPQCLVIYQLNMAQGALRLWLPGAVVFLCAICARRAVYQWRITGRRRPVKNMDRMCWA